MYNPSFPLSIPSNEPVYSYLPDSSERVALEQTLREMQAVETEIPLIIDGEEIHTHTRADIYEPHSHRRKLGTVSLATTEQVNLAIESALEARKTWAATPFAQRAAIFLRAANLLATKYRAAIVGSTMLAQSKNIYQAEIDSACELIDFLRFNTYFLGEIYKNQPISLPHIHNRMEYRPLEGFIYVVTPFNFTSIAGNLACAPALCGNVVVWKPALTQAYSAYVIMQVLLEAGLPKGVINMVCGNSSDISQLCLGHREFAGLHFTGSTEVFNKLWQDVAINLPKYKSYPRLVGETGGKDFVLVHNSANVEQVVTALVCGAFEYQGQKCSAASRAYLPKSLAEKIKAGLSAEVAKLRMGDVNDVGNFINSVIDEKAYERIVKYIDKAKNSSEVRVLLGGNYSKEQGYFIEPTVLEANSPDYITMCEEIFGPVLTIYTYEDEDFAQILQIIDNTSVYALTGAVLAQDRQVLAQVEKALTNSAGNFYLNDKPTGAVVAQQPFGGARKSGTNDKSGSYLNLLRWLSPRSIKENFLTPNDVLATYPYII